jgi:hypothetical protein
LIFHTEIPSSLNEREGFSDLTWSFIRGALTLVNIESRHLEVSVKGVDENRNMDRNLLVETKEFGCYADGIGLYKGEQVYLAESSLIYQAKAEKRLQDCYKILRAMKESWISQIRSLIREGLPPKDLAIFGSTSFKTETRFYKMDMAGIFRVYEINRMVIPTTRSDFGERMKACMFCCLEFALLLKNETENRRNLPEITNIQKIIMAELSKNFPSNISPPKPKRQKSEL